MSRQVSCLEEPSRGDLLIRHAILSGLHSIASLPRHAESLSLSDFGAITQIASAHAIIAVTLTGLVALQGAQYYSERQIQNGITRELKRSGEVEKRGAHSKSALSNQGASSSSSSLAAPKDTQQNIRRSPRTNR